jgi:signal transduction histidine kinase
MNEPVIWRREIPKEFRYMHRSAWQILLVEDDEDDYILVREWLSRAGRGEFKLFWASSSEQAFKLLESENMDAILVDYDLGINDGLDFVTQAIEKGYQAPIVMLTGRGDYEVDLRAMDAGVSDFLGKGEVNPQLLERTIRYSIERKKTEETLRRVNEQLETVNEELEDRVSERTKELIQKNEALMEEVIQRQRVEQELAEVQRRLLDRVEAQRLELAQELHDGPIQDLYGLTYQLSFLSSKLEQKETEEIGTFQDRLQNVIRTLRSTAGELRPPTLTPFGLEKAIRSHAEEYLKEFPTIQLELDLMPDEKLLPERVRLALFRIYQVALTNIVRHAQASQVTIRLHLDSETILLEIVDNGCGFIVPERWISLAREGHLGLVGAAERAEAIGGHLIVDSKPGQGTRMKVLVPRKLKNTGDLRWSGRNYGQGITTGSE